MIKELSIYMMKYCHILIYVLFASQVSAYSWDGGVQITDISTEVARGGVLEFKYKLTREMRRASEVIFRLKREVSSSEYVEYAHITYSPPALEGEMIGHEFSVRLPLPDDLPLTAPPSGNKKYAIWAEAKPVNEPSSDFVEVGTSGSFSVLPLTNMWLGEVDGIRVYKPSGGETFSPGSDITMRYDFSGNIPEAADLLWFGIYDTKHFESFWSGGTNTIEPDADVSIRLPDNIPEKENGYTLRVFTPRAYTGLSLGGNSEAFSIKRPVPVINQYPKVHKEKEEIFHGDYATHPIVELENDTIEPILVLIEPGYGEYYRTADRTLFVTFRWKFYPGSDNTIPAQWKISLLESIEPPEYPHTVHHADALGAEYNEILIEDDLLYTERLTEPYGNNGLFVKKGKDYVDIGGESVKRTYYEYLYRVNPFPYSGYFKGRVTGLNYVSDSSEHFTAAREFDIGVSNLALNPSGDSITVDVSLQHNINEVIAPHGPIEFLVELINDPIYAPLDNDTYPTTINSWRIVRPVANSVLGPQTESIDLGDQPLSSILSSDESCGARYRLTANSNNVIPERNTYNNQTTGQIFLEERSGSVKFSSQNYDSESNTLTWRPYESYTYALYVFNCGKEAASGSIRVFQKGCWNDTNPNVGLWTWGQCDNHDFVELFNVTSPEIPPGGYLILTPSTIRALAPDVYWAENVRHLYSEHNIGEIEIQLGGDFADWIPDGRKIINFQRED